ncbi:unnamed protein product [Closterium sp. Yama58-4]|nr:unnamed protein product [Closterium sp. Yama58-4]
MSAAVAVALRVSPAIPGPTRHVIAARVASPLLRRSFATLSPLARASSQSWDALSQPTGEWQGTLRAPVTVSGVGLHLGRPTTVTLLPAPAASGRVFHMMPLLDGSAAEWVRHIMATGIHPATLHHTHSTTNDAASGAASGAVTVERRRWNLPGNRPITVQHGDSFIAAFPRASPLLTYGIDFPHVPAIGRQWVSWEPGQHRGAREKQVGAAERPAGAATQGERGEHEEHGEQGQECGDYVSGIAPARTFCILEQVEQMRAAGLIKGGSLHNALVCSQTRGWVNPPLRLPLEPCRHKLLDLIGDLALCARGGNAGIPNAHIVAYKASHALHVVFGKTLMGALEAEAKGHGEAG